jgi:protein-disulfide isomerase
MSTLKAGQHQGDQTRKQRREQARTERREIEHAQAAAAVRRTRLSLLGIVVAVVVAGILVVLIASAGSGERHIKPGSTAATAASSEVTTLLAGIPQKGNVLGRPTAPVTLQYFGDLECPVCRAFTIGALPSVIGKWVRGGALKVEYRSLETATREPEVFRTQQVAALAAGTQNKMWNFVETFYHEQGEEDTGYVTESFIQGIAKQVPGLNLAAWTSERGEPALSNLLASDEQAATNNGLDGTPAFLLGHSGGALTQLEPSSFTEPGPFNQAIEKLVKS